LSIKFILVSAEMLLQGGGQLDEDDGHFEQDLIMEAGYMTG